MGAGVVAGLLVGVFFFLEWLAERRWQSYAAEARGRGVKLTHAELFDRLPLAEADNYAMLPLWQSVAGGKTIPAYPYPLAPSKTPKPKAGPPVLDLADFRRGMVDESWINEQENAGTDAEVVLRGLRKVDAELQQMLQGANRPGSRFSIDWSEGPARANFPHLMEILKLGRYVSIKIQAELSSGHGEQAFNHWQAGWPLARSADEDQTLIATLVHMSLAESLVRNVFHGLNARAWTDAQLLEIEGRLREENGIRLMENTLRGERAALNTGIEKFLPGRDLAGMIGAPRVGKLNSALLKISSAQRRWWRKNQLWANRYFDELIATLDPAAETWASISSVQMDTGELKERGNWRDVEHLLAREWVGTYDLMCQRAIFAHAQFRLAGLACALERCRRTAGSYPEKLDDLVPKYLAKLPHEPTNGEPFRYRSDPKDGYLLYSIGLDGKDEQGAMGRENVNKEDWPDWRWWAPRVEKAP